MKNILQQARRDSQMINEAFKLAMSERYEDARESQAILDTVFKRNYENCNYCN